MIPCVYFVHRPPLQPVFFCSATSVSRAQQIAWALRTCFGVSSWVADWRVLAHHPTALERAVFGDVRDEREARP